MLKTLLSLLEAEWLWFFHLPLNIWKNRALAMVCCLLGFLIHNAIPYWTNLLASGPLKIDLRPADDTPSSSDFLQYQQSRHTEADAVAAEVCSTPIFADHPACVELEEGSDSTIQIRECFASRDEIMGRGFNAAFRHHNQYCPAFPEFTLEDFRQLAELHREPCRQAWQSQAPYLPQYCRLTL